MQEQSFAVSHFAYMMGSELTFGGAAGGLQQDHQALQVSEDSRQPKADPISQPFQVARTHRSAGFRTFSAVAAALSQPPRSGH